MLRHQGRHGFEIEKLRRIFFKGIRFIYGILFTIDDKIDPKLIIRGTKGKDHVPLYKKHINESRRVGMKTFYIGRRR